MGAAQGWRKFSVLGRRNKKCKDLEVEACPECSVKSREPNVAEAGQ